MERPLDANKVFGDAALSDVTIKFSGRQIRAHKIILSIRSKYFERAFAKDSGFKESEEGVLELHGDDPDALEALLQYIYTSKYPTNYPDIPTSDWKAFVNLAITADKYGFRGLHFEALLKIRDIPPLDLDDSISMLCECSALFPDEFFGFRHIIGDQWRDRFGAYIGDKRFRELMGARPHLRDELYFDYLNELMEVAEFKTMLHADGKLATDFLQKFMSDYGPASSEC